jgi:hypothetical protein
VAWQGSFLPTGYHGSGRRQSRARRGRWFRSRGTGALSDAHSEPWHDAHKGLHYEEDDAHKGLHYEEDDAHKGLHYEGDGAHKGL